MSDSRANHREMIRNTKFLNLSFPRRGKRLMDLPNIESAEASARELKSRSFDVFVERFGGWIYAGLDDSCLYLIYNRAKFEEHQRRKGKST